MRLQHCIARFAAFALALGVLLPVRSLSQTFAAIAAPDPVVSTGPLSAGAQGSRVALPAHHRPLEENQMYGRVRDGVYTVDGMVAKLKLNYDVDGVSYLYLFVPGLGTAVVSTVADPQAITATAKLTNNELSFQVGDHSFKLTGVALANSKGAVPEHLYVKLDRTAWQLNRRPMLGFGNQADAPYQWPGALPMAANAATPEEKQAVPPVPVSLLPSSTAVIPSAPAAVRPVSLQ